MGAERDDRGLSPSRGHGSWPCFYITKHDVISNY